MHKKTLVFATVLFVILLGLGFGVLATRKDTVRKSDMPGTGSEVKPTSYDPVDYNKCVDAGGKKTGDDLSGSCMKDGKKYVDGNQ